MYYRVAIAMRPRYVDSKEQQLWLSLRLNGERSVTTVVMEQLLLREAMDGGQIERVSVEEPHFQRWIYVNSREG